MFIVIAVAQRQPGSSSLTFSHASEKLSAAEGSFLAYCIELN